MRVGELWLWDIQVDSPAEPADLLQDERAPSSRRSRLIGNAVAVQADVCGCKAESRIRLVSRVITFQSRCHIWTVDVK